MMSYSFKESKSYTRGVRRKVKGSGDGLLAIRDLKFITSQQRVHEDDAERYHFCVKSHTRVWREATESAVAKERSAQGSGRDL